MPFAICTPDERDRLDVRDKPYFTSVTDRIHIGYRKGKVKRSWVMRWRTDDGYRTETVVGVVPDDTNVPTGAATLSYQQMERRVMADKEIRCSFCGKRANEVKKLVAGPAVFICDECHVLVGYYMDKSFAAGQQLVMDKDGRAVLGAKGNPQFETPARSD